jgi:uncharacterized membrane protein
MLVLELAAEDRACYGSKDTMSAHLVAAEVAGCSSTKSAHEASIALRLHIGVCSAVLAWLLLAVLLALRVLILGVGALLRELMRGCLAGILTLRRVLRLLSVSEDLLASVYKVRDPEDVVLPLLSLVIGR